MSEPTPKRVVVFLQNAWSPVYAGGTWPRESWLKALVRSRSGQRLAVAFGDLIDGFIWVDNTTPIVGEMPSSVVPPDERHIRDVFTFERRLVVACGRQAEAAVSRLWSGPLLVMPHPASRLVTNELLRLAGTLVQTDFKARLALRQNRNGSVTIEPFTERASPC